MNDDPLTDIVRSLELTGGLFLEAEFTAPWAITSRVTEEDCRPFMPVPKQVIAYHVVTKGAVLVSTDDGEEVWVRAGDVVILPSNRLHVLSSAPSLSPISADDLVLPARDQGLVRIRHGGGGKQASMLCGFLASHGAPSALVATLPEPLIVRLDDVLTLNWIEASIALAIRELAAGRAISGGTGARLSELLLIEALRTYLTHHPHTHGWLAGMANRQISEALVRIHRRLDDPPAVTDLAKHVGMSRSAFVDQFARTLGTPPRRYILDQRMQAARLMLRDTTLGLAEISHRVGYDAPEAFSRAFKRETGQTPLECRSDRAV